MVWWKSHAESNWIFKGCTNLYNAGNCQKIVLIALGTIFEGCANLYNARKCLKNV